MQIDPLQLALFLLIDEVVILTPHVQILINLLIEKFDLHLMEEEECFVLFFRLRELCIRLTYGFFLFTMAYFTPIAKRLLLIQRFYLKMSYYSV